MYDHKNGLKWRSNQQGVGNGMRCLHSVAALCQTT